MMKKMVLVTVVLMLVVAALSLAGSAQKEDWVRTDSQGSVTVEVQLVNPDTLGTDGSADFLVYMTTHSGDLTQLNYGKLLSVAVNGSLLQDAVDWSWERKSSHHPVMRIRVDLSEVSKIGRLELVMEKVADVKERRFEWTLNTVLTKGPEIRSYALIPNAADGTITVVDGKAMQAIDTVKVGESTSHGIAVSKDGKYIYSGDMKAGKVVILDSHTREVTASFDVGKSSHGVDITPDGKYVLIAGDKVTFIDTRTNKIVATITEGLGESPAHFEFHPNGEYAYLTDPKSNTLTVINIPAFKVVNSIVVGDGPNESRISPDGSRLYVANWEGNEIAVVDTPSLKVVNRIPSGEGTHGVVVSPDGKYIWTANRITNDIRIIDAQSSKVIKSVKAGEYANHLAFSPDGTQVYVTNARDNEVVVVDAANQRIVGRIATGEEPHEVDFVPVWKR